MKGTLSDQTPNNQLHRSGNSRLQRLLPPGELERSAPCGMHAGLALMVCRQEATIHGVQFPYRTVGHSAKAVRLFGTVAR